MESELEALRARVASLEVALVRSRDSGSGVGGEASSAGSSHARLPSGTLVPMSERELAAVAAIFQLFDVSGTGSIAPSALQALHRKLGEPITDAEAASAVADIAHGGSSISFEDFCKYWTANTASGERAGFMLSPARVPTPAGGPPSPLLLPTSAAASTSSAGPSESAASRRARYARKFQYLRAHLASPAVGRIHTEASGEPGSLEWRLHYFSGETPISPWHDVPYKNTDGTYNALIEIPRWTRRKFEIATGEPFNPIKQDVKNGLLRTYAHGDMLCNYGAIPQTWEDPRKVHALTGAAGDADPIDVIELGSRGWATGSIVAVKLLGVLAMVDEGETDWKLLAISVADPLASRLHDVEDVDAEMPGAIAALRTWLEEYKLPERRNTFGNGGQPLGRAFARALVEETHDDWKRLIAERGGQALVTKGDGVNGGGGGDSTASSQV